MKNSKFIISQKDVVNVHHSKKHKSQWQIEDFQLAVATRLPKYTTHEGRSPFFPPKWNENHRLKIAVFWGAMLGTPGCYTQDRDCQIITASLSLHAHEFKSTTPLPDFASISWIQNAFLHPFCHFHPFPWKKISFTGVYTKIDSEKR